MKVFILLLCIIFCGCPSDFGGEQNCNVDANITDTSTGTVNRPWPEKNIHIDNIMIIKSSTAGP